MTKKGRCSVFRQRPFDVSATTGCCRGLSAITLRHFMGTIVERDCLMLTASFCDVLEFEERQRYGLRPMTVSVTGSICAIELGWLSGEYC